MKHKLVSIPRTTLLYLPVIKLSDLQEPHIPIEAGNLIAAKGMFVVACDEDTEEALTAAQDGSTAGIIYGETLGAGTGSHIRVDQGLDCDISSDFDIDPDLKETQYIVELDNRFGVISSEGSVRAAVSYIDDDNVASYYFSKGTDPEYVDDNPAKSNLDGTQVIKGPRGTFLQLKIQSSLELLSSTYLFDQLGGQQLWTPVPGTDYQYIDSTLRISGATTGSSIDIPIRFAKKVKV
jgi:hypothetical protein